MSADLAIHALVGLAPVVGFLAALRLLDSYQLVSLRFVAAIVGVGAAAAVACSFVNGGLLAATGIDFTTYSRSIGPVVEELAKALVVIGLIRTHRIGFLVDAAILGFAAGTGFAIVENIWYQHLAPQAGMGTWIVRGFGTALMHGGTTAIFAMMSLALLESDERVGPKAFVPGIAVAIVLHAAYNHLTGQPRLATLVVLGALPPLMHVVFKRSEKAVGDWLGRGFDADVAMLEAIGSGRFADTPAGRYLATLRSRFQGPVVADLLCYLRLGSELALRAKGILLMRENGFDAGVDESTRAKITEMAFLERSIGRTGLLAIRPLVHTSHRDLWQLRWISG